MSQHDAVLFANEAFYLAFSSRDMAAMTDMWATRVPVSCIHPGWAPLLGRDDVLQSWEGIFSGEAPPPITCHGARAHVYGDTATVLCYERIPENYLIATNIFVREGGLWKIVHHQAGPTNGGPVVDHGGELPVFN
jgi:ketosteroid isomerase-like protein